MIRRLTQSALFFLLVLQTAHAGPPPLPDFVQHYIDALELDYELPRGQLEPSIRTYLLKTDEAEPWAISGDFNGDGVDDWAGLLRNAEGRLDLVVVHSFRKAFQHVVLSAAEADSDAINAGVFIEPPGAVSGMSFDDSIADPEVALTTPGIHLFWFEKASVLFYWDGSSYREMVTSD